MIPSFLQVITCFYLFFAKNLVKKIFEKSFYFSNPLAYLTAHSRL